MENKDFEKDTNTKEAREQTQNSEENEIGITNQEQEGEQTEKKDNKNDKEDELKKLKTDLEESKEKYLRLYSEFDNFRRRNAKEKLDLIKTATEDLVVALLPVLDDFERAQKSLESSTKKEENKAGIEGFQLIQNKLHKILEQKGVKPMDNTPGIDFDPELHEAITQIPAPEEKFKGKVVDVVEKGYYLNDKVIRFAKVVIGS